MAERVAIKAAQRSVLGKDVRKIRREGRLPANVYGRELESKALEIDARDFSRTIKSHSVRSIFDLAVEGEGAPRAVVIRGITRAGGTGEPIHVDFFQIDPKRPIQTTIPVRLVGEAPAVRDLAGTLTQFVDIVSIRCLPLQIPEALEASATTLVAFDSPLTIADLDLPPGVEVLLDPATLLASVAAPRLKV